MEILRCLVYFPFDYYLIAQNDWKLGKGMHLFLDILLWSIRVLHVLSIMFWLLYCALNLNNRSNNDSDYISVSKGVKDVESETSSNRKRNAYKAFVLIFALMLAAIPFGIAFMSRLDSCHVMFDSLYNIFYHGSIYQLKIVQDYSDKIARQSMNISEVF